MIHEIKKNICVEFLEIEDISAIWELGKLIYQA